MKQAVQQITNYLWNCLVRNPVTGSNRLGAGPLTDQTLPHVASETQTKPVNREKLLIAALLGVGGIATFSWVALLGWGAIYLIGALTG